MKKDQPTQEGSATKKKIVIDELLKEFIKASLIRAIDDVEINFDVKCAARRFRFQGNKEGCELQTNISFKSVVIIILGVVGYVTKKVFW